MNSPHSIRHSPSWAHVLPLAVFMGLNLVPLLIAIENRALPWWRFAPEHWVYPVQTILVGGLLWFYRKHYVFKPHRGFGLAALLGVIGIVLWFLPAWGYQKLTADGTGFPSWLKWFGLESRTDGFDPSFYADHQGLYAASLAMRFLRLVIIVPLAEEIFWRGFLMRYIIADGDDFRRVPFGTHDWRAFGVVTVGVMLAHNPVDWLAAWIWGSLVYFLAVRTKSLSACILMHAVANLLLGVYVMVTRQWGYW